MVFLEGSYKERRDSFYNQIDHFWDRLYGMEYALYDYIPLSNRQVAEVQQATQEAYSIFKKTNQLVRLAEEETLIQLGVPKQTLALLKKETISFETVIGRFDFVDTKNGLKILEFNADTPTFIREVFEVNGKVANSFDCADPNEGEDEKIGENVRAAVNQLSDYLGLMEYPYVVFTAHKEDIEDRETLNYLIKSAKIPGAAFIPLDELIVNTSEREAGVYDQDGKKIDIVYRHTYPLEALVRDQTDDGYLIGEAFLQLVEHKKVGILNPPSAFLMQTKAMLAVIWGLHEANHPYFSDYDHQIIETYFLPTYLDEEPFVETGEKYVSKPVFGREGDTVRIKEFGRVIGEETHNTYDEFIKVFQKYVELPTAVVNTELGAKEMHLLIGSFVVGEKASAFGFRAGAAITDNLSYFLPCVVKGDT